MDVLDAIAREAVLELEDDTVVAFVPPDRDAVEEGSFAAARGTYDRGRCRALERVDPTGGGRRRRRRWKGVPALWRRRFVGSAAAGKRQQGRDPDTD